jgi:hypothetical protein
MSAPQPARQRLPNRRPSVTFPLEVGGLRYRAPISRFPEGGRVAEIFLSNHRPATPLGVALDIAAEQGTGNAP